MTESKSGGPLQGCRVLELGSVVAGPFCGRLFADFGAEVIKVEPAEGDGIRSVGKSHQGKSLGASSILRNKSLVSLDLRTKRGRDIIRKLVEKCDIVIENFRPGGLEKWGLGYEDLKLINPKLIMVPDDDWGSVTLAAPVPRLSKTPGRIRRSGGRIGQDTRRVLGDLAELTDAQIDRLETDKVIFCDSGAKTRKK